MVCNASVWSKTFFVSKNMWNLSPKAKHKLYSVQRARFQTLLLWNHTLKSVQLSSCRPRLSNDVTDVPEWPIMMYRFSHAYDELLMWLQRKKVMFFTSYVMLHADLESSIFEKKKKKKKKSSVTMQAVNWKPFKPFFWLWNLFIFLKNLFKPFFDENTFFHDFSGNVTYIGQASLLNCMPSAWGGGAGIVHHLVHAEKWAKGWPGLPLIVGSPN